MTPRPKYAELPDGLAQRLAKAIGEKPRIGYVSVANDAARVQQLYVQGQSDPRSLKVTYAEMFFDLIDGLEGEGLYFSTFETPAVEGQAVSIVKLKAFRAEVDAMVDEIEEGIVEFRPHLMVISPSVSPEVIQRAAKYCPVVYYAHSLFWPVSYRSKGASLKDRLRCWVRIRRNRKNLSSAQGVIGSADTAVQQCQAVSGKSVPFKVVERHFLEIPKPVAETDPQKLLYVGSLSQLGGADLLLRAFQSLRQTYPDISLEMIGVGSMEQELTQLAEGDPKISVTVGFDANAQAKALESAGLLVVPFPTQTTNAVSDLLPEALVRGVPAVVSSSTPVRPYEAKGCITYQSDNQAELVRVLDNLISDPNAYKALQANLPIDRSPYFDRSNSWSTGIAEMLDLLVAQQVKK